MDSKKVALFKRLAGQELYQSIDPRDAGARKLGAQLLLSEVLEYVISGLGVVPVVRGQPITEPDDISYQVQAEPNPLEMIDGLADTAYTMFWNALAFGIPLGEAFELVCNNNLEKFVRLEGWNGGAGELARDRWDCGIGVNWPTEVDSVTVLNVDGEHYAVGKDARGKVRKPSTYKPVELGPLLKV